MTRKVLVIALLLLAGAAVGAAVVAWPMIHTGRAFACTSSDCGND